MSYANEHRAKLRSANGSTRSHSSKAEKRRGWTKTSEFTSPPSALGPPKPAEIGSDCHHCGQSRCLRRCRQATPMPVESNMNYMYCSDPQRVDTEELFVQL